MPNVIHLDSSVQVSYPVREATLDITHAEHSLILAFSHEKVKMIKFIRAQYNLGLYEAKQVVATVIASEENKPEVQFQSSTVEVDWNTIQEGTMIYVRLYEDWHKRKFIRYNPDSVFGFVCKSSDDDTECLWQRAKLIND